MLRAYKSVSAVAFSIVACASLAAQTSTTGALTGAVTNKQGAPIAGASVRLVSGQITRTQVTDAAGNWRMPLLNPGAFQITITKAGFTTIDQRVDVSLNETRAVNFSMAPEGSAVVEVISASAGVDTTSAQIGTNFSTDTVKSIPMGRSMESFAAFAPGVLPNVDMDGWDRYFGQSIGGGSGAENQYVVDGLTTTDARYGGNGAQLVTDFIDQVEVQTGAFKPEYSSLGGVFNVVTKSGSNTFKGSAWLTWDPNGIAARPKRTDTVTQADRLNRYDIGFEVGGPLMKDKLFYFVGMDATISNAPSAGTNNVGLSGSERKVDDKQFTAKLNYYVTPDFQVTLSSNYAPSEDKTDRRYLDDSERNSGGNTKTTSRNTSLVADWVINEGMILSVKVGRSKVAENYTPTDGGMRIADRLAFNVTSDQRSLNTLGRFASQNRSGASWLTGGNGYFNDENNTNDQMKADFSWFLGSHQMKAGISHQKSQYRQNSFRTHMPGRNPDGTIDTSIAGFGGQLTLKRSADYGSYDPVKKRWGGAVAEYYNEWYDNGISDANYDAIYVQDTWEAVPGLKLSYGVRAEKQELIDGDKVAYLKFGFKDQLQPRIGVIWDPSNNGKSKVTVNYAQYNEVFPLRFGMRYRGGRFGQMAVYRDLETYNPATGAYTLKNGLSAVDPAQPTRFNPDDQAAGYNNPPVVDGTKSPMRKEVILGYDRELPGGWNVGAHVTFRHLTNPIEDMTPSNITLGDADKLSVRTFVDPGLHGVGQAVLGNPRGGTFTWMTNPKSDMNAVPGVSQKVTWESNLPTAYNKYNAVDVTLTRQTERSYLNLSYTWSRAYGNYEGVVRSGQRDTNGSSAYDNPGSWADGPLNTDHTHVIKAIGSQTFDAGPGQLTVGATLNLRSGAPFTKESQLDSTIGWNTPDAGRYFYSNDGIAADHLRGNTGARHPFYRNLDLRVEYLMKFNKISVLPSLDIFNTFNTRVATRYYSNYNDDANTPDPEFGHPDEFRGGRNYRAGVKIRF